MFEVEVRITLKKAIADPQGLTVKDALKSLGFASVSEVRMGKLLNIKLDAESEEDAKKKAKKMCEKLLANPIIEDFSVEAKEI